MSVALPQAAPRLINFSMSIDLACADHSADRSRDKAANQRDQAATVREHYYYYYYIAPEVNLPEWVL